MMSVANIDNPYSIPLPPQGREILQRMFVGYQRLIIERELGGGFSQSRIFVVRPFKATGAELPAVVKMAPATLIEKERVAYQTYIQNRLPNAQNIQIDAYTGDEDWAGLRYPLAGGGIFEIESLHDYLGRPDIGPQQVDFTLNRRLFKSLGHLWRTNQARPGYPIRGSYNHLLPVNLIIRPLKNVPTDKDPHLLTAQNSLASRPLQPGELVQAEGFVVTGVEETPAHTQITLNGPASSNRPGSSYRLRLWLEADHHLPAAHYRVGREISVVGEVITTQAIQLRQLAETALGQSVNLDRRTLTLHNRSLPNPLLVYPDILNRLLDVRLGQAIHGDLNLENILVDPHTGDINLIDFADARSDYVLHDLLRLETGVITRLLPLTLAEAHLPAETIHPLYQALHHASRFAETDLDPALEKIFTVLVTIRQAARRYLFDYDDIFEYYQGLTLYLLGALKFDNLNAIPAAKPAAFWGAATLVDLTQTPAAAPPNFHKKPTTATASLPRRYIWPALLILAVIAGGMGLARTLLFNAQPSPLIATIIGFQPQTQYQTADSNQLLPVDFGIDLRQGDLLYTHQGASVDIACANGLLLRLAEQRTMTVNCLGDAPGIEVIGRLAPQMTAILADASSAPIDVSTSAQRGSRTAESATPRLLSSRNSAVAQSQPAFVWQPVDGVTGYRLTVTPAQGKAWSRETGDTALAYPPDVAPLAPGSSNIVEIMTLNDVSGSAVDKTLLRVLAETDRLALTEAEASINALDLADPSRRFLLAQLYSRYHMWSAAIDQLSPLTESPLPASANLWLQLGALYAQTGLYVPAEDSYHQALTLAQQTDDLPMQAAAYAGLAQTSAAFNEIEQAIDHLQTAESLYQAAGQVALAEAVAGAREKLE